MKYQVRVVRAAVSRLSEVDFDNLPFGKYFSDHMFVAEYRSGQWQDFRIEPLSEFATHPATMALHYGQAVFEGMKASKSQDGRPMLFRPEMHARRLNFSARRLAMPEFPEDLFVEALHMLVSLDEAWIPPQKGSALYIRPFMYATDPYVGVRPSNTYRFVIFTCPVGPYYPKPVSLLADTHYIRAARGGTGEAKAAGNYAGAMLPARLANEKGYDQVLWLDAREFKYIQEVGTMNIFFVIDGKVITPDPEQEGTILRGITRDSILHILRDEGYPVEERRISIDEVVAAYDAGTLQEVFGTGTAAVVAQVWKIAYEGKEMVLPSVEACKVGPFVKSYIDDLRAGLRPDKFGWVVPVRMPESVKA